MERFQKLSKDKIKIINSVVAGSPSFSGGWLSFFPVGSEILFDNPQLSTKVVQAGVWTSGSAVFSYEIARKDGSNLDLDRYPLSVSGSEIFKGGIDKNFPEHHLLELPSWYN